MDLVTNRTKSIGAFIFALTSALSGLGRDAFTREIACGAVTTQAAMSQCAADGFRKSDELLASIVKEMVEDRRFKDRAEKLRAAEVLWIGYRQAQCSSEAASVDGGSLQATKDMTCRQRLTRPSHEAARAVDAL